MRNSSTRQEWASQKSATWVVWFSRRPAWIWKCWWYCGFMAFWAWVLDLLWSNWLWESQKPWKAAQPRRKQLQNIKKGYLPFSCSRYPKCLIITNISAGPTSSFQRLPTANCHRILVFPYWRPLHFAHPLLLPYRSSSLWSIGDVLPNHTL